MFLKYTYSGVNYLCTSVVCLCDVARFPLPSLYHHGFYFSEHSIHCRAEAFQQHGNVLMSECHSLCFNGVGR